MPAAGSSSAEPLFDTLDVERAERQLTTCGWGEPFVVPGPVVDQVVEYARSIGVKRSDDPHLFCEAAHRIAHDPGILAVARRHLFAEPILCASHLYWTIPPSDAEGQRAAAAEGGRFHYDIVDVKALTVFIYLSDVDRDCGPHVVLEGTQGRKRSLKLFDRFLADEEVERLYPGRARTLTGKRGTGWFEDITCYHKQETARKTRLMLSINYSLHRQPLARDRMPRAGSSPAIRFARSLASSPDRDPRP